jgi:predicted dehydrogenase
MKTLNIAVVGAGLIGKRHIGLIADNPRTQLCAIVDPSDASPAHAAQLQVPHYKTIEALLAVQKPDAVILATPNDMHVGGALQCLQHHVPALIEKPVAHTVQAGEQLLAAMAHNPTPMLVGHHRRYSSNLRCAFEALARGDLGRIVTVMGSAQWFKPAAYFEAGPWRKFKGAGPILINLIHEMDNLRHLCGEINQVHAFGSNAVRGFEVEDTAVISLRFANGALGTFTLSDTAASPRSWEQTSGEDPSFVRYPQQDCYFIAGTRGSLAVPTMQQWTAADPSWLKPLDVAQLQVPHVDPMAAQLEHLCDVVQGMAQPLVTVASALNSLRVVEAVCESIATGRAVAL